MIITKKTSPHKLFWGAMPAFQEHGQCHVLHARWDRQTHLHQSQLHLSCHGKPTMEPCSPGAKVGGETPWKFPRIREKKNTWDICKCEFGPKFSCFYYLQTKQPKKPIVGIPTCRCKGNFRKDWRNSKCGCVIGRPPVKLVTAPFSGSTLGLLGGWAHRIRIGRFVRMGGLPPDLEAMKL